MRVRALLPFYPLPSATKVEDIGPGNEVAITGQGEGKKGQNVGNVWEKLVSIADCQCLGMSGLDT